MDRAIELLENKVELDVDGYKFTPFLYNEHSLLEAIYLYDRRAELFLKLSPKVCSHIIAAAFRTHEVIGVEVYGFIKDRKDIKDIIDLLSPDIREELGIIIENPPLEERLDAIRGNRSGV